MSHSRCQLSPAGLGVVAVVSAGLGCRGTAGGAVDTGQGAAELPADFLWGAAVAGFQVDPGCPTLPEETCEDRASDWYQWVTDPDLAVASGTYLSGDPLSLGPGHWELYPEDFDAAREQLGLGAFRTSIEWSRLFPDVVPDSVTEVSDLDALVDADAVAAYHAYFSAMRAADLQPMVTLNHYTLPLWIHDGKACHYDIDGCTDRGWLDADRMTRHIALYAGWCAREFGEDIDLWATLNEPFAIVFSGYALPSTERTNPPAAGGIDEGVAALFAQIEAHGAMYDAVHAWDDVASVGVVTNLAAVSPRDPEDPEDVEGAEHFDYVYNRVFLEGTVYGQLDRDLDGVAEETREDLAGRMDFIGVNFYTRTVVGGLSFPLWSDYAWTDWVTGDVWNEDPTGLGEVALLAAEYGLPVYITETGTPDLDGAGERFLLPALDSLAQASGQGADVRGFFYWSLVDNYEWNHGMGMQFGLFELDTTTKARTLRPVGEVYRDRIAEHAAR